MDNTGDSRATVLVIFSHTQGIDIQPSEDNSPTLRSGGGGMAVMVIPIDDAREIEKNQNGTGVGEEGSPAYTLDTRQRPAVAKGTTVRRLTPVECERLQGFPDNWTEGQADTHRYKQMGNAVAVPVVSWIVKRLMEASE
jgi:DNA (cytosine-5)-methyltransferase 1